MSFFSLNCKRVSTSFWLYCRLYCMGFAASNTQMGFQHVALFLKDFIRRAESSNLGTLSFRNSFKSMRNIIRNWLCIMIIKLMLTIGLWRDESLWDEPSDLSVTIGLLRAPYRYITDTKTSDLCKTTSDFGVAYRTLQSCTTLKVFFLITHNGYICFISLQYAYKDRKIRFLFWNSKEKVLACLPKH